STRRWRSTRRPASAATGRSPRIRCSRASAACAKRVRTATRSSATISSRAAGSSSCRSSGERSFPRIDQRRALLPDLATPRGRAPDVRVRRHHRPLLRPVGPPAPPQPREWTSAACYAVSTGPDPLGTYHRYAFERPLFPDYPRPAVWPDGYYVATSTGDDVIQKHVCIVERAKMLAG